MTLLWHLLAADLRRHRMALVGWQIVIGATSTLEAISPLLGADDAVRASTGLLRNLLWLTELLFTALLVPMVIQTHSLVGSNAFWMTRPIRPHLLMASKAILLLGAMVGVPVVARIAVMALYHVPAGDILAVSVDSTLYRTLWLTAVAVIASLTPSVARFALVLGGVLIAVATVLAIATAVALAGIEHDTPTIGSMGVPDPTTEVVFVVLLIAGGVALLLVQYRMRARVRAVMVGAAGVAIAMGVAAVWPWPLLAQRLEAPLWAATSARSRLMADADTVIARAQTEGTSARGRWRSVDARVFIEGLEPGWAGQIILREATLKIPGRGVLVSAPYGVGPVTARNSALNPVHEAVRAELGVQRLADTHTMTERPSILTVRDSDFAPVESMSGVYRGRFQVVPTRYAIEARLPLRAGAIHQEGAYRLVIASVDFFSGIPVVEVLESDATTILDRTPAPQRTYYLRNTQRSEAIAGTADAFQVDWAFIPGVHASGSSLGFSARRLAVEFPVHDSLPEAPFSVDQHWLEGAELVVVRATQAESFERTLEIPDFPLRVEPRVPPAQ